MAGLTFRFSTIRASVASVATEINRTTRERRILFGPGFHSGTPRAATAVLVDQQTLDDIQEWGEEGSQQHATE